MNGEKLARGLNIGTSFLDPSSMSEGTSKNKYHKGKQQDRRIRKSGHVTSHLLILSEEKARESRQADQTATYLYLQERCLDILISKLLCSVY